MPVASPADIDDVIATRTALAVTECSMVALRFDCDRSNKVPRSRCRHHDHIPPIVDILRLCSCGMKFL